MSPEAENNKNNQPEYWMQKAMRLAQQAEALGEVPVGAVLVKDGELIAEGYNRCIIDNDPTAHAEVVALRNAGAALANYRQPGTTLYVTLEPCPMCASALVHARVERVVFAASDPRTGAAGSVMQLLQHPQLNHHCDVVSGVLEQQASSLLKQFFKARRKASKKPPTE